MGLFNKNTKVMLLHEDGLDIKKGLVMTLILNNNGVSIKENFTKKEPMIIKLSNITNAGILRESEIVEKSKSVLGRAVVGGLVLGPVGAIVGSVSGVGNKEKKTIKTYFIINYKEDDEVTVLTFLAMDNGNSIGLTKFDKELKDRL